MLTERIIGPHPCREKLEKADAENARLHGELKECRGKRNHWRDRAKKAELAIQAEHSDPAGTIWEHADKLQKENAALRSIAELEEITK
jgi:predicted nuclease with TOPRIM domain